MKNVNRTSKHVYEWTELKIVGRGRRGLYFSGFEGFGDGRGGGVTGTRRVRVSIGGRIDVERVLRDF